MNTFSSFFSSSWSEKFLKLKKVQKSNDEDWEEKAVESLVKKLSKSNPEALKILEIVLEQQCAKTPCVTIDNTIDGRMQIHHRKIFPHVAYCKVWRWPDLKNHNELKQIQGDYCTKSFYAKKDNKKGNKKDAKKYEVCVNPYHYERTQANFGLTSSQLYNSSCLSNASISSSFSEQQSFMNQSTASQSLEMCVDQSINTIDPNSLNSINQSFDERSMSQNFFIDTKTQISPISTGQQSFSNYQELPMNVDLTVNEVYDSYVDPNNFDNCRLTFDTNLDICRSAVPSMNWCSVVFFEYKNRLSRQTISSNRHVISGQQLPKYLNRNQGIQIHYKNGEVYIECNCKVFIQSTFLNLCNYMDLKSVVEMRPGNPIKIFDEAIFERMIQNHFQLGYEALARLVKFTQCTVSFMYGWDDAYSEIFKKPCWLEISMDHALITLDKPLSRLKPSNQQVTSVS